MLSKELYAVWMYFNTRRRIGHTVAAIYGVKEHKEALLLVKNKVVADLIRREHGIPRDKIIWNLDVRNMQGIHRPLVLDNSVIEGFVDELHTLAQEAEDRYKNAKTHAHKEVQEYVKIFIRDAQDKKAYITILEKKIEELKKALVEKDI